MGNSSNAYITKQPNAVDPSEWINKQQEISQYYDELAAKKEKEKEAKQQKLNDLADKTFIGKLDLTGTGNKEVDQLLYTLGYQSLADLKEADYEGRAALNKYGETSKEFNEARSKYNEVLQRPAMFKLAYSSIGKEINKQTELLGTGKYVQTPENVKALDEFSSGELDIFQGKDKKMYVKKGDKVSEMSEYAKNFKIGGLLEKFETTPYVQGVVKGLGDKINESDSGFTTTSRTNSWEDYTDATGKKVGGMKSQLENFYEKDLDDNEIERILATKGEFEYNKFSQEEKDKRKELLISDLVETSKPFIKETLKNNIDFSARNTAIKNSQSKGAGNEGTYGNIAKNRVRPTASVWGDDVYDKDRWSVQPAKMVKIGKREELQLPTFNVVKDKDSKKSYSNATIESYTYDDKGNLYAKISYVDKKAGQDANYINKPETKKTAVIRADSDTKRDIANFLGISMDDLWSLGVDKKSDTTNTQTTKSAIQFDAEGNIIP